MSLAMAARRVGWLTTERQASPRGPKQRWHSLVAHTRKAGRAAYRAALLPADTRRAA
jgi:hypothetical protein